MTGLENIIREIETESAETVSDILGKANDAAAVTLRDAEKAAEQLKEGFRHEAERKAAETAERAAANDEMELKRAVLKKKQEIIRETLDGTRRALTETRDKGYFEMLTSLLNRYAAEGKAGEILMTDADKKAMTKEFETAVSAHGLKVSDKALAADSGFVLVYGSIEINCTVDAIFDAYADELSDMLGAFLFENGGGV